MPEKRRDRQVRTGFFRLKQSERENSLQIGVRTSSLIAAILAGLALTGLVLFSTYSIRDRARLIRDNENEQILNRLFTSSRDYDSFSAAIEADSLFRERVRGFAVYGDGLLPLGIWGDAPAAFDEKILDGKGSRLGRYSVPERKSRSVKFIMRTLRRVPPQGGVQFDGPPPLPPPGPPLSEDRGREESRMTRQNWFFDALRESRYVYIDISHPDYWRAIDITDIAAPVSVILLWVLAGYMRLLYIRNAEYRKRIEAQRNLVVLGTAAATLAHEIKNPLLSIRLQTGILAKTFGAGGEVAIINEEVERLSSLVYRVSDYLRDARGNPSAIDIAVLVRETGERLLGRDIIEKSPAESRNRPSSGVSDGCGSVTVHADTVCRQISSAEHDCNGRVIVCADPERLRSVFENLIRNAIESGDKTNEVSVLIECVPRKRGTGSVRVIVRDRGKGVAEADLPRVFDPFFTRKSAGTGIGLSISRRFIEAAGGTITLANRDGGGAEAIVQLEMRPPAASSQRFKAKGRYKQ